MDFLSSLLSLPACLQLSQWQLEPNSRQLTLELSSTQLEVECPVCHEQTKRIHSHYQRTVADLACGETRVQWHLQVRKFFCDNEDCHRRIFSERLSSILAPWGRKSERLLQPLTAIGLALGGASGQRLSAEDAHPSLSLCSLCVCDSDVSLVIDREHPNCASLDRIV